MAIDFDNLKKNQWQIPSVMSEMFMLREQELRARRERLYDEVAQFSSQGWDYARYEQTRCYGDWCVCRLRTRAIIAIDDATVLRQKDAEHNMRIALVKWAGVGDCNVALEWTQDSHLRTLVLTARPVNVHGQVRGKPPEEQAEDPRRQEQLDMIEDLEEVEDMPVGTLTWLAEMSEFLSHGGTLIAPNDKLLRDFWNVYFGGE